MKAHLLEALGIRPLTSYKEYELIAMVAQDQQRRTVERKKKQIARGKKGKQHVIPRRDTEND